MPAVVRGATSGRGAASGAAVACTMRLTVTSRTTVRVLGRAADALPAFGMVCAWPPRAHAAAAVSPAAATAAAVFAIPRRTP